MTVKSKRTIVSVLVAVIILVAYVFYMRTHIVEDLQALAKIMLVFIGIGMVSAIVIYILFHIIFAVGTAAKGSLHGTEDAEVERIVESTFQEDEMDKLINLRSSRAGYICAGIGIFVALAATAFFDASAVLMINIIFASLVIGTLAEGCTGIYLYRRGVKNG